MKTSIYKVSPLHLLVTLGIVFGDIGTSPLYVFSAISGGKNFDELLIMGSLSCIFWTLILITTVKYVYLALNADNHGEGGIFALYALLRRTKSKWIIYPALLGCATLISDGFITPAISISSAVEGLSNISASIPAFPIVCTIIIILFFIQQFGTRRIGGLFGPVMLIWFLTIGSLGVYWILKNPAVLRAVNPMYAISFLQSYPEALLVLGAVFLCTTGAEALYSDLGHCGKKNIRITWIFVLSMLLFSYFGQAAYCLSLEDGVTVNSVFYSSVPKSIIPLIIIIATSATIIASQALITGVFSLVNEAMKLKLWPSLRVKYPSTHKGQVYIPGMNYFLMAGCLLVMFIFRKAANMEAAYGLTITIDMLMTSLLLGYLFFLHVKKRRAGVVLIFLIFISVEIIFLLSNLNKIVHGGLFTLILASLLFFLLLFYYKARKIRNRVVEYRKLEDIKPMLEEVQKDGSLPHISTNLVFPVRSSRFDLIDSTIVYSLFYMQPKRAAIYWFLHVEITDNPYGAEYSVHTIIPQKSFFIKVYLGFKEPHVIDYIMKTIHKEMIQSGEISVENIFESVSRFNIPTDFKYIFINSRVASDNQLTVTEMIAVRVYRLLKSIGFSVKEDFGLELSNTIEEKIPIDVAKTDRLKIERTTRHRQS